jgi:platelet-activating factor acetylhydrolase
MVYTLFDAHGPHPVGATTFAITVNVCNPQERILSDAKVKATAAGRPAEPALKLEEVAFTAFYPAKIDVSGKRPPGKGLQWIPRYAH